MVVSKGCASTEESEVSFGCIESTVITFGIGDELCSAHTRYTDIAMSGDGRDVDTDFSGGSTCDDCSHGCGVRDTKSGSVSVSAVPVM